jgi:hypothetical protein
MNNFDDYLRRLRRELHKLEGTSTPIARRNARARVLTAMRALRAAVDKSYPPIVDRTGVKRLKTFAGRLARLNKAGWVETVRADAGLWATAGITVKRMTHTDDGDEKCGHPGVYREAWLIPRWARAIGLDKARLREAKKSVKLRNAAIVAEALATS